MSADGHERRKELTSTGSILFMKLLVHRISHFFMERNKGWARDPEFREQGLLIETWWVSQDGLGSAAVTNISQLSVT